MKFLSKAFLFVSAIAVFNGCGIEESRMTPGQIAGYLEGEQYFTLKNLAGEDVSLKEELGKHKAVLINFFATWCPPCREEIPDLNRLQEKHAADGLLVLGVDVEESEAKAAAFAKKYNIVYPVVLDSQSAVAAAYGLVGIPSTFLVNAAGEVIGEYHAFTPKLVADVENTLK